MTVTVAIINGWGAQWYGKLPAESNVYWNVWPCWSVPESKTPSASDVTVCGVMSWLIQQTVVPTGTVTVSGSYAKLMMLIRTAPASQLGGGGPAGRLVAGVLPTSAQTATASVSAARCRTLTSSPRRAYSTSHIRERGIYGFRSRNVRPRA